MKASLSNGFVLISTRAPLCKRCRAEIDEASGHIVEAFETTGELICESCWDQVCEDAAVDEFESNERIVL